MVYSIVSVLCIITMVACVFFLSIKFCSLNRSERIIFIKNFKKGKCSIIYLVAIPLIFMGLYYNGNTILNSCLFSISKAIELVVLKFDVPSLAFVNLLYNIALYMCFIMVMLNAIMIVFSFLHQNIWYVTKNSLFVNKKVEKCILIGNNVKNGYIYNSCNCQKIVFDVLSNEDKENLFISNVVYRSASFDDKLKENLMIEISRQIKKAKKSDRCLKIIVNTEVVSRNLSICNEIISFIRELPVEHLHLLDIYVFGEREYEDVYAKYEIESKGCLHYINSYRQIAIDFIDKYPLTKFLDENQVDYKTALIKDEVDINVLLIGFGKSNQQIFLTMSSINQFLTKDEKGNIVNKRVNYFLFDKRHTNNNKSLNHRYFRYKYAFYDEGGNINVDKSKYLELPDVPVNEKYEFLDINDGGFYRSLKKSISNKSKSLNVIVVSFGSDYENIDLSNKLIAKLYEWDIKNVKVFTRVRDKKIIDDSKYFVDKKDCILFGSDKDVVFDYKHIVREKFSEMAVLQNMIYDIEHDMSHKNINEDEINKSRINWYIKRTILEKESNVYACLGLRNKLQLMGFDYVKSYENDNCNSNDDFKKEYEKDDLPCYVKNDGIAVAVKYPITYKQSLRCNLARIEHNRWNAYMIMQGFIPATIEEIKGEKNENGKFTNGKNYFLRRHGNLTTFEGLIEFRKILSERDNTPEEDNDVIKYDYQQMDGVCWLLSQCGYKIIKKGKS